jgi:hypothetical protein
MKIIKGAPNTPGVYWIKLKYKGQTFRETHTIVNIYYVEELKSKSVMLTTFHSIWDDVMEIKNKDIIEYSEVENPFKEI